MRIPLILLLMATLAACTVTPPAVSPTPAPERLRSVTGPQICAALPEPLRVSLALGAKLGHGATWGNNVATATAAEGRCQWYDGAPRSLKVWVEAYGSATRTATDHAKQEFAELRAFAVELSERPDDDLRSYALPVAADHGDAAFSQTSTKARKPKRPGSRKVQIILRQGPWLVKIEYRGTEEDGELPAEAELRRGADQVARVFSAEMARDPGTVAPVDSGVCGALSIADVASAFYPSVTEMSSSGDADETLCTWTIRDEDRRAPEVPGGGYCGGGKITPEVFVPRCGDLRVHVIDLGESGRQNHETWFGDRSEKYDHHASFRRLTGIGDRAFVVGDQAHVLTGDHLLEFDYWGENIGGGSRDALGFREPSLDEAALRKSLIRLAPIFVSGLSARA
ncbi:hypothetical protein [Nonomuraea sp. SBT364]|uniref:hypothetical protein n=1 Tax=Nonomuraea sp. SBT364 TaxID=1580530 RepID=UPI0012E0CF96|nr:hypothetical protein [Nonomuraea sp. SBT364]